MFYNGYHYIEWILIKRERQRNKQWLTDVYSDPSFCNSAAFMKNPWAKHFLHKIGKIIRKSLQPIDDTTSLISFPLLPSTWWWWCHSHKTFLGTPFSHRYRTAVSWPQSLSSCFSDWWSFPYTIPTKTEAKQELSLSLHSYFHKIEQNIPIFITSCAKI